MTSHDPLSLRKSRTPCQVLIVGAAVLFLTNWLAQMYFAYNLPRVPDPISGHTYLLRVHYTIVYMTFYQYLLAGRPTFYLSISLGLVWFWQCGPARSAGKA